ncbi:MAG: hypothetical protein MI806_15785 [Minwuiales bacterium]|nr:hypothetical protein [Minwuiales bacterium]
MNAKRLFAIVFALAVVLGPPAPADEMASKPAAGSPPLNELYQDLQNLESMAAERRSSLVTLRQDLESMRQSLERLNKTIEPVAPPASFINEVRAGKATERLERYIAETETKPVAMEPAAKPAKPAPAPIVQPARSSAPQQAAPVAAKAEEPVQVAAAERGAASIHLASYRSRPNAERGWIVLRDRYNDMMTGLTPEYVEVDLGPGKGRFVRLVVRADNGFCKRLKQRGGDCSLLR